MEWNVSAGGGNFEKAPAGNHPAVLVALVDLGMQWMDAYKDRPGKYMRKSFWVWELVTKKQAGMKDRNLLITADLTVSLHENATMTAWLKARLGRTPPDNYNIFLELGQPCLLSVVEEGGYPKVKGMSAIPDGFTIPAAQHKPFGFKLNPKDPSLETLPDWLPYRYGRPVADVIRESKEIAGDRSKAAPAGGGATGATSGHETYQNADADIPF